MGVSLGGSELRIGVSSGGVSSEWEWARGWD